MPAVIISEAIILIIALPFLVALAFSYLTKSFFPSLILALTLLLILFVSVVLFFLLYPVSILEEKNFIQAIFRTVSFHHGVLYLQEFIPHGVSDVRAFVIGDHVVAAMHRVAETWKTNVSLGARPMPLKLDKETEDLAIKAAKVIGCKVAGCVQF